MHILASTLESIGSQVIGRGATLASAVADAFTRGRPRRPNRAGRMVASSNPDSRAMLGREVWA